MSKSAKKIDKKSRKSSSRASTLLSKMSIKIAMYMVGIAVLIIVSMNAFDFGVKIYSSEGMDPVGYGKEIVITIPSNSTTGEIASILKNNGLIESELAFLVQTYIYDAEIYSGTYTLNTEYGPEEIIDAMRPVKSDS